MAVEQAASASQMEQTQVVLSPLTATMQAALPSLTVANSQMALCLQVSIDALVVNSSSRALLAFSQSFIASVGRVMLPDLEVMAIGEMLWGFPLEILLSA